MSIIDTVKALAPVRNYQTTLTGVAFLILAGLSWSGHPVAGVEMTPAQLFMSALAAFGFIAAKDGNVTGV